MHNQDTNNLSIIIEDLAAENADEIKGGPSTQSKRILILKSSVAAGQADDDNTLQGFSLNHNETFAADEASDNEAPTLKLADLILNDEQEEEIKGGIGMLVPAVQKVREAASFYGTGVYKSA